MCKASLLGSVTSEEGYLKLVKISLYDATNKVRYIPDRPSSLPTNNVLFPPQFEEGKTYPWFSNVIPSDAGGNNGLGFNGSVPPPIEGLLNNLFNDGQAPTWSLNSDGYGKYRSTPGSTTHALGVDAPTLDPKDPLWTIFLTNIRDRGQVDGVDNYRKYTYMYATSSDKLKNHYRERTQATMTEILSRTAVHNEPYLSAFSDVLIKHFVKMHTGDGNYPQFVYDYFYNFVEFVGFGDPSRPGRNDLLMNLHNSSDQVFEFFEQKIEEVITSKDETCLAYHFYVSGLAKNALVMEMIHNVVAFFQFLNTTFLIIRGTTPYYYPPGSDQTVSYDFFQKYRDASGDKEEQLNVVREAFRLMVPNSISFSSLEPEDPNTERTQARHIHQSLMVYQEINKLGLNDPTNPLGTTYYEYDTSRYDDFKTDLDNVDESAAVVSDSAQAGFHPLDFFEVSSVDGETLIDKQNPKLIPVMDSFDFSQAPVGTSGRNASYWPFGVGNRRCAGEGLAMQFILIWFDVFQNVSFEFRTPEGNPDATQEDLLEHFGDVPLAPFSRSINNLFVTQV